MVRRKSRGRWRNMRLMRRMVINWWIEEKLVICGIMRIMWIMLMVKRQRKVKCRWTLRIGNLRPCMIRNRWWWLNWKIYNWIRKSNRYMS